MMRLAIIGSGDLGQLIAYHAKIDSGMDVVGYFDDTRTGVVAGIQIFGGTKAIESFFHRHEFDALMVGVGYNHMAFRAEMYNRHSGTIPFANVIHSSSYIDKSAVIGQGLFILPHCTIDAHVVLGNNVLLNTATTVAHHTSVADHCFFAPSVAVAGKSRIGERVVLGINSTVIDHVNICADVRTGAGAVVTEDLTEPGLYLGIPAKKRAL